MQLENEIFLRQKHFSEQDARDLISSNLEEIQRLEALSGNLLALTNYERAALELTPLKVKNIVNAAQKQLQKVADAKKVHIEADIQAGLIQGHEPSLVQLLTIIMDNAIKYGPHGGKVLLKGTAQGSQYALSITDEGPGIPAVDLPHIFDRLYRGDKARSSTVPGYGLGLALAKEIADANHAGLTVTNGAKKGATFTVMFAVLK
jgi:K+-sensing histidine kinase KdpD